LAGIALVALLGALGGGDPYLKERDDKRWADFHNKENAACERNLREIDERMNAFRRSQQKAYEAYLRRKHAAEARGEVYKADPNLDLVGMSKDFVKNRDVTLRKAKESTGNRVR
jgi:hypothetical protein